MFNPRISYYYISAICRCSVMNWHSIALIGLAPISFFGCALPTSISCFKVCVFLLMILSLPICWEWNKKEKKKEKKYTNAMCRHHNYVLLRHFTHLHKWSREIDKNTFQCLCLTHARLMYGIFLWKSFRLNVAKPCSVGAYNRMNINNWFVFCTTPYPYRMEHRAFNCVEFIHVNVYLYNIFDRNWGRAAAYFWVMKIFMFLWQMQYRNNQMSC